MTPTTQFWLVDLRRDCDLSALNDDEMARANRYRCGLVRQRFLRTRSALRSALGRATGIEPSRLEFALNPFGKPLLKSAVAQFNVSHSSDFALIGVGPAPLGVDIEEIRDGMDYDGLAVRYFSRSEHEAIAAASESAKRDLFFTIWTRKEAAVKAAGSGLTIALDSFDCSRSSNDFSVVLPGPPAERWRIADLRLARNYVAAVAVPPHLTSWECRDYHSGDLLSEV